MGKVLTLEELLVQLSQRGVKLRVDGDQLIASPGGNLTDQLQEAITAHRNKLMDMVKKSDPSDDVEAQEAAEGDGPRTSKYGFEPIAGLPSPEQVRQRSAKAKCLGEIIQKQFGFVKDVLQDYGETVFGAFEFISAELRVDEKPPMFLTDEKVASWAWWGIKSGSRQVVANLLFQEETPLCFVVTSKGIVKQSTKSWRTDGQPDQEGLIKALKAIGR